MINHLVFHFCAKSRLRHSQVASFFIEKMKRNSSRGTIKSCKRNKHYFFQERNYFPEIQRANRESSLLFSVSSVRNKIPGKWNR